MSAELTGHCLCGAVHVTLHEPGHEIGACHCGMCRRWTGSAFMVLPVPADKITVTGLEAVKTYASSDWAGRSFCGTCGTTLWYRLTAPEAPQDYYMSAGLLDDMSSLRMTHEIFIDRKPVAFAFAGPTKQMTEAEFLASLQANPEE